MAGRQLQLAAQHLARQLHRHARDGAGQLLVQAVEFGVQRLHELPELRIHLLGVALLEAFEGHQRIAVAVFVPLLAGSLHACQPLLLGGLCRFLVFPR